MACIGYTHATDLASQDLDGTVHAPDNSSAGCTGGDVLASPGSSQPSGNDDSNSSSPSGGHSSGESSAPTRSSQPRLGWQSLLPGSIQ